jgi:(1->4)-alpha-D-glucan 1-alpha-D-glucosylmutase
MLATSTHDNKRSEDVRARIDVISEVPAAWRLLVRRWSRLNRGRKRTLGGAPAPSRNDEYLLYQTLIGCFPGDAGEQALEVYRQRIEAYMIKAAREAKVRTSWLNVNEPYESALIEFVRSLLARTGGNLFFDDLVTQSRFFTWYGALNSVSMAAIKLTSPGVPDIFQGNETLDYSLVDPDNRRPVDYGARMRMLRGLARMAEERAQDMNRAARELIEAAPDGRAKMWVILRALALRRQAHELFFHGDYAPARIAGPRERHAIAYVRRHGHCGVLLVAARMSASLGLEVGVAPIGAEVWQDTSVDIGMLPPNVVLTDALTGARLECSGSTLDVGRALHYFPAAILHYDMP